MCVLEWAGVVFAFEADVVVVLSVFFQRHRRLQPVGVCDLCLGNLVLEHHRLFDHEQLATLLHWGALAALGGTAAGCVGGTRQAAVESWRQLGVVRLNVETSASLCYQKTCLARNVRGGVTAFLSGTARVGRGHDDERHW